MESFIFCAIYICYIYRRATSGGGQVSPCTFLKIEKKCPDFGKMCPVCVHLWVEILINAILRASWRKKTKIFPCGAFFVCVTHETFIEVPPFQETSPSLKNSWLRALYIYIIYYTNIRIIYIYIYIFIYI